MEDKARYTEPGPLEIMSRNLHGMTPGEIEADAKNAAIHLAVLAGLMPRSADRFGEPFEETVEMLLTMAFMREPRIAQAILDTFEN